MKTTAGTGKHTIQNTKVPLIQPVVPIKEQLKSLREAHERLIDENKTNIKTIKDLKIQMALLVHQRALIKEDEKEPKRT